MLASLRTSWRGWRSLGIGILILSTIHVPLPQADYHNIRHHDSPGEICVYHDHLLRWHPTADADDDVALLHWHWFVPLVNPGARQPGDGDDQHSSRPGPAIHAHIGDWLEPDWTGSPVIQSDGRGRLLDHLILIRSGTEARALSSVSTIDDFLPGLFPAAPLGGPAGPRAARINLLQRWNC